MSFLPILGEERPERADAAANREKVLCAAEKLFARHGPANVSMDAVAAEAGVGKGTLFRRFGDRASLARAVLEKHEVCFQEAIIRGGPPLGPGASALERLVAFGRGYVDFLEEHGELLREAEARADGFFESGVYAFYRMHVTLLLRDAGVGERADFLADAILLPLAASSFSYFRRARRLSVEELKAAHADLCARLIDCSG